jgi:hypothetical protein
LTVTSFELCALKCRFCPPSRDFRYRCMRPSSS